MKLTLVGPKNAFILKPNSGDKGVSLIVCILLVW